MKQGNGMRLERSHPRPRSAVRDRLPEITPPQGGNSLFCKANPPAHTSDPRIGSGACLVNVSESTQAPVTAFSTRGF